MSYFRPACGSEHLHPTAIPASVEIEGIEMQTMPLQPAEIEDVDLFELLEQWEPTDSNAGPPPRTPFGSAPALTSYMGAQDSYPLHSEARALSTPVPGIPLPPERANPFSSFSPAFQQPFDQAPGEAAYLMYAPALYLKARHLRGNPGSRAYPPALSSWHQEPVYMPPRQSTSSANILEGESLAHGPLHKPDWPILHEHA